MELDKDFELLKKLSSELEDENISLDDSVKKYTEACVIIENCVKELTTIKGTVTVMRNKIDEMIEENLD